MQHERTAGKCTYPVLKKSYLGLLLIIATSMPATSFHFSMTCAAYLSPCQKSTDHLKMANCLFRRAEIILLGRHEAEKTIENTINRDCKAEGGYIGFSANFAPTRRSLFLKLLREHYQFHVTRHTFTRIWFLHRSRQIWKLWEDI